MQFVLVRHAETYGNTEHRFNGWRESPLTSRGIKMEERMLEKLEKMHESLHFSRIFCSPTLRTRKPAEQLSQSTGLTLQVDDILREFNFGVFDGLTAQEAAEQFPDLWQKWMKDYASAPLSETGCFIDFHKALGNWLSNFDMTSSESVIIFTHGGTFNSLLLHLLDLPMSVRWHFAVAPGGIAVIDAPDGYGILKILYSPDDEAF